MPWLRLMARLRQVEAVLRWLTGRWLSRRRNWRIRGHICCRACFFAAPSATTSTASATPAAPTFTPLTAVPTIAVLAARTSARLSGGGLRLLLRLLRGLVGLPAIWLRLARWPRLGAGCLLLLWLLPRLAVLAMPP